MKQTNAFKKIMLVSLLGASTALNAQTAHPPAFFGYVAGAGDTVSNWYKDYVGVRLEVTAAPTGYSSILGDKFYTVSNNGDGSSAEWGGVLTTPIVNDTVVMATGDTFACSPISNPMTRWIALIWRGPETGACDFSVKALAAQTAGAVAVVLINEYADQGPVDMGAGTSAAGVTIPVYMIGNQDGAAISAAYDAGGLGSVKMTITPWGNNKRNDLGFAPGGYGIWHDFAIPYSQLSAVDVPPAAYKAVDGAFVANYGTANAHNVKLAANVTFTPNTGPMIQVHTDTETLATFNTVDSIWAFWGSEYNLTTLGISGPGKFSTTYTISSDSVSNYGPDTSYTYSFYATDSLYSKGQYNFAQNVPEVTQWYIPDANNYLWGVPYFVSKGGWAAKNVQVSVAGSAPGSLVSGEGVTVLLFKWNVTNAGAGNVDTSIVSAQLSLVGEGTYNFNGSSDSSFDIFNVSIDSVDAISDTLINFHPMLDSNSWYFVVADQEGSVGADLALGVDGILDAYPRTYLRYHSSGYREFYNPVIDTDLADESAVNFLWGTYAFPGASAADVAAGISYYADATFPIDSIFYNGQIGLIPALPMMVTRYKAYVPDTTTTSKAGVNNVSQVSSFELYPNPASTSVNVSLQLISQAKIVSYTIVDGMGRIINKDNHYNVLNDTYTYNSSNLPSGNYNMIVRVDGKLMVKKFTVIKQ